jgi:hypothetical protein
MTSDPIAEAREAHGHSLDELVVATRGSCPDSPRLIQAIQVAKAAADRLALAVLEKYGEHDMACSHWQESGPCTCGYDALRTRPEGGASHEQADD